MEPYDIRAIEVESLRGVPVTMYYREGTTDLSTIAGSLRLWGKCDDEYDIGNSHPATFLDIGAHIAGVVVAVLVDNPECRAVVVEPLPENLDLLHRNIAANGVGDRVTILEGAIGLGGTQRISYRDPADVHRWVGNTVADDYHGKSIVVPAFTLAEAMDLLGDTVDLVKIDCEGCEWMALTEPAVARALRWEGEWHTPGGDAATVVALLEATHDVVAWTNANKLDGSFKAVLR